MIKGAIFDIDGTLLDSMCIWDTIGEKYLHSLGKEPQENLAETFKTFTLRQSAEYYRKNYGVSLSVEEIINSINEMVADFYIKTVPLKKGVIEFLDKLKDKGVKMCIATVTDKHLVEVALKRCGVYEYFSEIFTCASVGYSKETPHIYREAQKHLGTEKSNTVVFEDVYHALKMVKDEGFLCTAIYDEHEHMQEEIKHLAAYYLEDFTDFEGFWSSINKNEK